MPDILPQSAKIGIAGLGLIGGSLALAFTKAGFSVLGFDINSETVLAAQAAGCVEKADTRPGLLFDADYLFIALYPEDIVRFADTYGPRFKKNSVVIDCCGIKKKIVEPLSQKAKENGFHYIGGHPMAGTEKNGFSAARGDLFKSASFILTPTDKTDIAPVQALLLAAGFARVIVTTPQEHDRMIAFTSQLPHVLACAYVKSPCCPGHSGFSAGSYRDVSRVAHLSPEMWSSLFIDNKEALCGEIDILLENMTALRYAISAGDHDGLRALLAQARAIKDGADNAE